MLLRALSCLGCSLLSQPHPCTCTCTSVPLCSLLPALWCLAIPASSSSLAGETTAKRDGGRCFVVLLRAFCSFSIVSRLYVCVPLLPTLCSLTIQTSSLSVRSRQRAMAMAVVATVLLCLCEHSSLVYLCLSVESVPYPHSVFSSFLNLLYVRPRQRTVAVVVVLLCFASIVLHCSLAGFFRNRASLVHVCTSVSLCLSLCRPCMYLCVSVTLSVPLLVRGFPKHDGTR